MDELKSLGDAERCLQHTGAQSYPRKVAPCYANRLLPQFDF